MAGAVSDISGASGRGIVLGLQGMHQWLQSFIEMGLAGPAINYSNGRSTGVALARAD
ncbi:MAG: hypothetical protein O3C63_05535 [Cyanobacteria bacterium]|nr:hypothetical protein [Cyanobacteriota bacterium]MDA1021393.1 hypothetical protein [Cyanobacteriota bacterium]